MRGMIVIMALSVVAGQAQETRELTRQEKKEMQARLDSLLHVEAEEAVNARAFTLEADKVMFKYGETAYVTSTTNFVSVKGDDAVVQVAFNVPVRQARPPASDDERDGYRYFGPCGYHAL